MVVVVVVGGSRWMIDRQKRGQGRCGRDGWAGLVMVVDVCNPPACRW